MAITRYKDQGLQVTETQVVPKVDSANGTLTLTNNVYFGNRGSAQTSPPTSTAAMDIFTKLLLVCVAIAVTAGLIQVWVYQAFHSPAALMAAEQAAQAQAKLDLQQQQRTIGEAQSTAIAALTAAQHQLDLANQQAVDVGLQPIDNGCP